MEIGRNLVVSETDVQEDTEPVISKDYGYHSPLRIIKTLLPEAIIKKYRENPILQTDPEIVKAAAAVLYTRITILPSSVQEGGTTPESEHFKILRDCMNMVFDHIITHGGDVIKEYICALDATCISTWNTENEHLSVVTQRVANCGVSLLRQQEKISKEMPGIKIAMGVDVGEVWFLSLGGYRSKWIFFVAGDPVKESGFCAEVAKPFEFIASSSAWSMIQEHAKGTPFVYDNGKGSASVSLTQKSSPHYYIVKSLERSITPAVPFLSRDSGGSPMGSYRSEEDRQQKFKFETALLCHIPKTLQFRLYSLSSPNSNSNSDLRSSLSNSAWVPELRVLTYIYIVLDTVTFDWEGINKLSKVIYTCQAELSNYGSCIDGLVTYKDKLIITAAYGLPTTTWEDNALRAITAAQAIQQRVRSEFKTETRMGIAQGKVIYSLNGTTRRSEQNLTGTVTTIAKCLAFSLQPRTTKDEVTQILVDESIFNECNKKVVFEELQALPHPISQSSDKVQKRIRVFRPLSNLVEDAPTSPSTSMVFSETGPYFPPQKVIDEIRVKITKMATTQQGGFMHVESLAGMGKSRLAVEIRKMAFEFSLGFYITSGHKYQQNTLFFPWKSIFNDMLKLNSITDAEMRQNRVLTVLQEMSPASLTFAPLLNSVFNAEFPSNEAFKYFFQSTMQNREVRFEKLKELLMLLMEWSLRQSPTIIIIDEAHWIDASSWALILSFVRKFSSRYGLVIVTLSRVIMEKDQSDTIKTLTEMPQSSKILMPPLTNEQAIAMVCQLLEVDPKSLPSELVKVIQRAQGVPLILRELAQMLRENPNVSIYNGTISIRAEADLSEVKVADSVSNFIRTRLDKLSPTVHLIVRVASVIGSPFDLQILSEVYPAVEGGYLQQQEWKEALASLEKQNVIKKVPGKTGSYMFFHPLICDATYELLLSEQRKKLHQACARYYEAKYSADLTPYYPLLAHHYKLCELEPEQAIKYLEKAGNQAWSAFSVQDSYRFFSDLLHIYKESNLQYDAVRVAEWEMILAIVHFQYYRTEQAIELLKSVLSRLDPPGIPWMLSAHLTKQIASSMWRYKFSNSTPSASTRDPYDYKRIAFATQCYRYLSACSITLHDLVLGFYAANRSLTLAEKLDSKEQQVKSLTLHAYYMGKVSTSYADDAFERAATLAKEVSDPHVLMANTIWCSFYRHNTGNVNSCISLLHASKKQAVASSDSRAVEDVCFALSLLYTAKKNYAESLKYCQEGDALAVKRGSYATHSFLLTSKAKVYSLTDKLDDAAKAILEAQYLVKKYQVKDYSLYMMVYGINALIYEAQNNFEGVMEMLGLLATLAQGKGQPIYSLPLVHGFCPTFPLLSRMLAHYQKETPSPTTQEAIRTIHAHVKSYRNYLSALMDFLPIVKPFLFSGDAHYYDLTCSHAKASDLWKQAHQLSVEYALPAESSRIEAAIAARSTCPVCKYV